MSLRPIDRMPRRAAALRLAGAKRLGATLRGSTLPRATLLAALFLGATSLAAPAAAAQDAEPADRAALELRAITRQLEAERNLWRAREREWTARIAALEASLLREQELRYAREQEWLEFTRLLSLIEAPSTPPVPDFLADRLAVPEDPAAAEERRRAEAARARGREMRSQLDALLTVEQVMSLDFLELGAPFVHEGRGVVGPVVGRWTDDRGRLIGLIAAERMWIEVGHASRSITLVLEDGYESSRGERRPFESPPGARDGSGGEGQPARPGIRRIYLPSVDPAPWIDSLPELIDPSERTVVANDGRWNVVDLRMQLNALLRESTAGGASHWRIQTLGAVSNGRLRDLQLVELDRDGRVVRRLFADAMSIERRGRAVELVLEDGSQERAGRIAPFLAGRYRLVLPRANVQDWLAAGVPGLSASGTEGGR